MEQEALLCTTGGFIMYNRRLHYIQQEASLYTIGRSFVYIIINQSISRAQRIGRRALNGFATQSAAERTSNNMV